MSLFLATLLTGIFVAFAGSALLSGHSLISSALKGFPRSTVATAVLFGSASIWFLFRVWNLSAADFGEYRSALFMGFFGVAALSFIYVPDFLAVRGLAGLMLLVASPLLDSAYMEWDHPQRLLLVSLVYLGIVIALNGSIGGQGGQNFWAALFLPMVLCSVSQPSLIENPKV
jgi:hypothetical protein